MKKLRQYLAETIQDDENAETIEQLERILTIRRNRQQKLEVKTRELRRELEAKEQKLRDEQRRAEEFEAKSKSEIFALRRMNGKAISVQDIYHWKRKEVDINKNIKKLYEQCDEIKNQRSIDQYRLSQHLKTYKQAVVDAEKISQMKDEIVSESPDQGQG